VVDLLELDDRPIRLSARGEWLQGDQPLHPRVAQLFARSIAVEAGRYVLRLRDWTSPIEVEDTAYFVRSSSLDAEPAGGVAGIRLLLSDGAEERLDPRTLMQSADNVLYCRIRRGGQLLPCRFSPGQYHELVLAAGGDDGTLTIAGARWRLSPYDPTPRPG
jgi:hypothetical protein